MKKVIFFFCIGAVFLLQYIVNKSKPIGTQALTNNTEYQAASSPTWIPTATIVPSATIGYEATVFVAQATADEARRVNAQVTSEAEQRLLEYVQMTAESDRQQHEVALWTQIAGATVIPLTATAQVSANTQIAEAQNIVAAGYTQQAEAPTQAAAMIRVQNDAAMLKINNAVNVFVRVALGLFCIGLTVFLFRHKPIPVVETEDPGPQTETTLWIGNKNTGSSRRYVIPCTPQQLTELALKITTGKKTLAINNWEGADTLFTRPVIRDVRGWMQTQIPKFAVPTGDGQLVPTEDGFAFFRAWLENQKLPGDYEFAETEETEELKEDENLYGEFVPMNTETT